MFEVATSAAAANIIKDRYSLLHVEVDVELFVEGVNGDDEAARNHKL